MFPSAELMVRHTEANVHLLAPSCKQFRDTEGKTETVPVDRICCPIGLFTLSSRARIGVVVAVVRFSGQQERPVCVLHKGLTATIVSFSPLTDATHTHKHTPRPKRTRSHPPPPPSRLDARCALAHVEKVVRAIVCVVARPHFITCMLCGF